MGPIETRSTVRAVISTSIGFTIEKTSHAVVVVRGVFGERFKPNEVLFSAQLVSCVGDVILVGLKISEISDSQKCRSAVI